MQRRIKNALKHKGSIIVMGVDPAMHKPGGIAIIGYYPCRPMPQRTVPIAAQTFKGFKHRLDICEFLWKMKKELEPDFIHAMGTEKSYRGKYHSVPYAMGQARGIVEGLATILWPGIICEGFTPKEWRNLASGDGNLTKSEAIIVANHAFKKQGLNVDLTEDAAEAYLIACATAIHLTQT